ARAARVGLVRSGDQHEATVVWVVVGQRDRQAHRAGDRHAVFGVPGLEVRVPVETVSDEAGHVVDPALVDVDVGSENGTSGVEHARISGQFSDHVRDLVYLEDRTDRPGIRFGDHSIVVTQPRVVDQFLQLGAVPLDLAT